MPLASPGLSAMPRIAIVGSGFAGIGMAIRLLRMGITPLALYEAADDIGGTWRDNTYPGAACDVPSHLYSFSFEPNPAWTRAYGQQAEILEYLRHCARKYGVEPLVRLRTRVAAARYDETRGVWKLALQTRGPQHGTYSQARTEAAETTEATETVEADVVICAAGPLSRPALPQIAGLDRFEGKLFHSARWDHAWPLDGKRVAVIGTGASAIQFVPQIQPRVSHLAIFQRTPPWILPKPDHPVSRRAQWLFRHVPLTQRLVRSTIYWRLESRAIAFVVSPRLMKYPRQFGLSYLARKVKDPQLRAKLTPDYLPGCKRILLSSDYYPAVTQPNVDVIATGIREVVADGVVTVDGTHHRADTIICGTGFHVNDVGAPFDVTGVGGADLGAAWLRDGPQAYLGTSIAGFPNFFMMVGPNTGLGHNSMIYMIESQVRYIADCIRALERRGARTMDVRPDVQRDFNAQLQATLEHTVWQTGCHSWYQTRSGKNTSIWPGFTFSFRRRTRRVRESEYRFTA